MSGSMGGEAEKVRVAVPVADLSAIDAALSRGGDALREALERVRPADIGRDLSRRSSRDAARLVEVSNDRRAATMLRAAHPGVAASQLAAMDPTRAIAILEFLPVDVQVRIFDHMGKAARDAIESKMPPDRKRALDAQVANPRTSVGRHMTPKVWRSDTGTTAREALDRLRTENASIEVGVNCYVTEGNRLAGVVALRDLAIAAPDTKLADVMARDPIAVRPDTDLADAAEIIQTHDFLSLPVTDDRGDLVGALRVDDLLDAALERMGTGVLNQGGVSGAVAAQLPYFQNPVLRVVRGRIVWLILLFVAETLTGTVLRHFEDVLSRVVALSFFIPLLIGTGGNAGSQTVSTVIRALALGEVRVSDAMRVVTKEVSAGLLLGISLGLIAYFRARLWGVTGDVAMCVGITVLVVCTWANTVGAVIPIAAQRMKIDPTVVSGPLITTLVDASGLFIYLTIAKVTVAALVGH